MKLPRNVEDFMKQQPEHRLGDKPIEGRYHEQMVAVMKTLDEFINPGQKAPNKTTGIVVLMFDYGEGPGRCNFISNGADRRDIVTLFKEMIARFEGQPEVSGKA